MSEVSVLDPNELPKTDTIAELPENVTNTRFGKISPKDLVITSNDWDYMAATIHHIKTGPMDLSFIGFMLQSITIEFSFLHETAMIYYDPNKRRFVIDMNPAFFRMMTLDERVALLLHEISHMTDGHLLRCPAMVDPMRAGRAADLAINQRIPGIPTRDPIRGLFIEDYGFPPNLSMEDYYDLLGTVEEEQLKGDSMDSHSWKSDDESDLLDTTEELIKRTMIKSNFSHTDLPKSFAELLEKIDHRRKSINWTQQFKMFVRKHASGINREYTRTRPSRRFDYEAPGMRMGNAPKALILSDTSGSMSIIETNAGFDQVDQVMKIGTRDVMLGFWHTKLYHLMKYKPGKRDVAHKAVESGGTCFESCAQYINSKNPDAVIVFTDGCFDDTKTKVLCPILFVITHCGVTTLPTSYPRQRMIKMPHMGQE